MRVDDSAIVEAYAPGIDTCRSCDLQGWCILAWLVVERRQVMRYMIEDCISNFDREIPFEGFVLYQCTLKQRVVHAAAQD